MPGCLHRAHGRFLNLYLPMHAGNVATPGLPALELPNIGVVEAPTVAQPPGAVSIDEPIAGPISFDTPVQCGFVLHGQVRLFGSTVVGNLEKWTGPPPEDVVVGLDPPSIERVTVPGDFRMSTLVSLLQGTQFDDIIFRNVAFYHQNYAFDKTKSIGWHFNADWVIDSSCGHLYEILTQVLQVDKPLLSVHASFGDQPQRWNAPLGIHSLILEGVFPNLMTSPVSGLILTSIGVMLLGIRGFSYTPQPHSTLSFGFDIFGKMKLDVPGSILPLALEYQMGFTGETINLSAEIPDGKWNDALGVKGMLASCIFTSPCPGEKITNSNHSLKMSYL